MLEAMAAAKSGIYEVYLHCARARANGVDALQIIPGEFPRSLHVRRSWLVYLLLWVMGRSPVSRYVIKYCRYNR